MSTLLFPTLPGLDIAVKRSEVFATSVQVSASGVEARATWWSTPRYTYDLTFNFLRQANFSALTYLDEMNVLLKFFEVHKGQFESFLFVDPLDGLTRRVRFAQDHLDLEQIVAKAWKCDSIQLISVK